MNQGPSLTPAERSTRAAIARASLRGEMRRLAERLAATLASVREDAMRLHLVGEALAALESQAAAMLLDVIWSDIGAGRWQFAAAFQDLAILDRLETVLSREALGAIRAGLAGLGYAETRRLLERDAGGGTPGDGGDDGGAPRPAVPLGTRISMARRPAPRLIERLMTDPDHRVIATLLHNPRLTENEVVGLAASPRSAAPALEAIARESRWVRRYRVALALVNNPRTPVRIALALLPRLLRQDLVEVAEEGRVRLEVREKARALLELRPAPHPVEVTLDP